MTKVMQMHDFSHANTVLQDWKDWRTGKLVLCNAVGQRPGEFIEIG